MNHFIHSRYLENSEPNSDQWTQYVTNACEKLSARTPEEMQDFKDLEPVLNKLRSDELSRYAEYNQLRRMIERGKMFEYISFSLKNELEDAYRRSLRVYCLSFLPEGMDRYGRGNLPYRGSQGTVEG